MHWLHCLQMIFGFHAILAVTFIPPSDLDGVGGYSRRSQQNTVIPAGQRQMNAQAINWTHTLVLAATSVAQVAPPFFVPQGASVRVRANNGAVDGNDKQIFVAQNPSAFNSGSGTPLAPLDDVSFPVDNVGRIWVWGTQGDGVVISVSTAPSS